MGIEHTPSELREGVRSGILAAVERDAEMRGGRTARRLAAAGVIGAIGAIGVASLLSGHPYGHHPPWHLVAFTAVWSGLLVVSVALLLLRVRTPSLQIARSACVGILALGLAGICGSICPDQHFLAWWSTTPLGARLNDAGGAVFAALCFGLVTSLFFGVVAAFFGLRNTRRRPIRAPLPAAMLVLLLAPGIALQSFDSSWAVFGGWLLATAVGAWGGVASGIQLRAMLRDR
ncbi:MAG: hypothetical protein WEF50_21330 [Myxococcota bacterium]